MVYSLRDYHGDLNKMTISREAKKRLKDLKMQAEKIDMDDVKLLKE